MAVTDRIFIGGAFTFRDQGDASTDGDPDYDDAGGGANSNWVDEDGAAAAKPTSANKIIFNEFAGRVPADYSNSAYPHVAGNHWCCCKNMDQGGIDANGFLSTRGYTGDIYGYGTRNLLAKAAQDQGGGIVRIRHDGALLVAGDYVTLGLTTNYNREFRVVAAGNDGTDNYIHIKATYVIETFEATDTVTVRTPLRISVSETYDMVIESNSTIYIECGSTTPNIPNLIFNSATGLLHLSSEVNGSTGNFDDILVTGDGTLNVADDTHVTKITVSGDATNAVVIVGQGVIGPAAASSDLDAYAGKITWDSKIGDVICDGGVTTYCQNVGLETTVDIDLLKIRGGKFNRYGKGTLKGYEQFAGTLTALGDGDLIIGSAAVSYILHGGVFDMRQAGGRVSFFAGADIDVQGGELKPANGRWKMA